MRIRRLPRRGGHSCRALELCQRERGELPKTDSRRERAGAWLGRRSDLAVRQEVERHGVRRDRPRTGGEFDKRVPRAQVAQRGASYARRTHARLGR